MRSAETVTGLLAWAAVGSAKSPAAKLAKVKHGGHAPSHCGARRTNSLSRADGQRGQRVACASRAMAVAAYSTPRRGFSRERVPFDYSSQR